MNVHSTFWKQLTGEGKYAMDKVTNTKGDAILEAALHLFATQGYAETNVPSIAKAAQVGVGTVYRYFKNKDSILNHLFQWSAIEKLDNLDFELSNHGLFPVLNWGQAIFVSRNSDIVKPIHVTVHQLAQIWERVDLIPIQALTF